MHRFYVFTASSVSVSGPHLSISFRVPGGAGWRRKRRGRVSYSGKQRLKQLSKHCQQCSWALEKDLPLLLCVLSEVTHWRLWFLSWTQTLALHHPSWCTTGSETVSNMDLTNEWLIWESKYVPSFSVSHHVVMVCYSIFLLIGQAHDCPSNTSCRLLGNSWGMLFFFQMMTLLEFAFKDIGPATRVTGSVCTCQTPARLHKINNSKGVKFSLQKMIHSYIYYII